MTPVLVREMPLRELVEVLLSVCGAKDDARIAGLLARGSAVRGASRFRWEPIPAEAGEVRQLLATFPGPDDSRPFDPTRCVHVRLCSATARIDLPREVGNARRLLKRRSYWDVLMEAARAAKPQYAGYSYRDRADLYRVPVPTGLETEARLLKYPALAGQIARTSITFLELLTKRPE